MKGLIARLMRSRRATSAIEYALIAGLLGVALLAFLQQIGLNFSQTLNVVASQMPDSVPREFTTR